MMSASLGQEVFNKIILNGGFEDGKTSWWGSDGEIIRDDSAESHAALKLKEGFLAQDKRPVQGGKRYRLSMQIRADDTPNGSVFVQLSYRGEGVDPGWRGQNQVSFDDHAEAAVLVTGGSFGWRLFSVVVAAPANARELVLYLRKKGGTSGFAYYTAIEIIPTDDLVLDLAELRRRDKAQEWLRPVQAQSDANRLLDAQVKLAANAPASTTADTPANATSSLLTLVDNGQSRYHIHVGSHADLIILSAAAELADGLKHISGAAFAPLAHDASPMTGPLLVVGRDNALTQRLCPDIPYAALGSDGFVIRSVGPHIVIAGATPRGTMYGVNWFMDHQLGVKWLSPAYTYWPDARTIQIAAINEQQVPRFEYREVLSHEGEDRFFRAHNLLNGESHGPSFSSGPPELDSWRHDWMARGGYANFFELLPPDQFAKDHPDWYAGGQLAMMNPGMRAAMAGAVIERLRQVPDYKNIWFDIHDMDWGWDMDPASQAFAAQHGGTAAAPRLDLVIDVAKRVRTVLPGARLAFNAYHWSFTPPRGMTVPDYVLVFPMTIQVDYSTMLNKGRNSRLGHDLAGWNAIARHVLVWDHITNFSGFVQPTPNIYPIGASIQWLASLPHVTGYFAEGSWDTPAAEFAALRAWMIARLLWNPKQDVRALVAEYCRYYYGDAGPAMQNYIALMHAAIARSGEMLGEKTQVDLAMLNLDFIRAADLLFDEAEAAVKNQPVLLAHVQEARMAVDYVVLVRRQEYDDEAGRRGLAWSADKAGRLARFNQAAKNSKLQAYRQGGNLQELAELFSVERHAAQPSDAVRGSARADWVEYQDLSFNRYDSARIVQDALASDGAAVRMNGDSSTWAVQFKLDKLPREGLWDLYVEVRLEADMKAENALGQNPGVRVGSYPPMNLFTAPAIGAFKRGAYLKIKVPGGPFSYDPDHGKGIYIQAPVSKEVKYVYVDRLLGIQVAHKALH